MNDRTNVVNLFWNRNIEKPEIINTQAWVCDRVVGIQKELKLHHSFTKVNVIWALATNVYSNFWIKAVEHFLSNPDKHDFEEMMKSLYKYIKKYLDKYMERKWQEVEWWWSTLNSLLVMISKENIMCWELFIELEVNDDYGTDILIKDIEGKLTGIIHNNELAIA